MKILKNIVEKIFLSFGKKKSPIELRVLDLERRIDLAAAIITEQSKLISSLAIIQNDLAIQVRDLGIVNSASDEKSYLELLSIDDDEFIN
jgi:hypothetical protein